MFFCVVLFFFLFCFCFVFFIKISKFALPGVMLKFDDRKKEREK